MAAADWLGIVGAAAIKRLEDRFTKKTTQNAQNATPAPVPVVVVPRTNSIPYPAAFSSDEKDSAKRT
ncbi:hypothetical protein VTI28DRAFT_4997 [Corynascus sepedonium]